MTDVAKILVVDDEEGMRAICSRILRQAGHAVETASSGDEGLARLPGDWDLVLTDLSMPGKTGGMDVVRKVRGAGTADVLIMTATPDIDSAIHAIREGAYDYLVKPFTPDDLLMAVERCLEKRRLSRELAVEKKLRADLDAAYRNLAAMDRMREIFGQFVTREVAELLMAGPADIWKTGERKVVTVMFADVRRFTSYTEGVPPEEVVAVLNEIFQSVTTAIHRERGILNKFMGDGMLALFGAPVAVGEHALAAVRAAVAARDAVQALADSRRKKGVHPLEIGLGINTGEVVAGCLGTSERAEYSVIGHAVNAAARLEEMAAVGEILIGPETARLVRGTFDLQDKGLVHPAGFSEPMPVWKVLGRRETHA